jgi:pyruvate dehydrogenase E1 component alpha subunit
MYVEFDTYRYHGHSMSDPGTTYRTREEVGGVRTARDPIDYVKKLLIDNSMCTAEEIKAMEKDIRNAVQADLVKAKAGKPLADDMVYKEIYGKADGVDEPQDFVRMPDYQKSIGNIV